MRVTACDRHGGVITGSVTHFAGVPGRVAVDLCSDCAALWTPLQKAIDGVWDDFVAGRPTRLDPTAVTTLTPLGLAP